MARNIKPLDRELFPLKICFFAAAILFSRFAWPETATQLAIAAGNNQTAEAGTAVPGPVCVVATDANNTVVAGVTITFGNVTGGGGISGAVQTTNAGGIVTLGSWTLGAIPGLNSVTASAPGLNSLVFSAIGTPANGLGNAVTQWNNTALHAIQNTGAPPTVAARALAMAHTGIFDAWAAFDARANGTQLGGALRRPAAERTAENKRVAISYAAYRILLDLFPSEQLTFDNQMLALKLAPADTSTDPSTPAGIGNTAAAALLKFRHDDGSNQLGLLNPGAYSDYTSYAPVNDPDTLNNPNRWQPLRIVGAAQQFVTPQWGAVTPFAIEIQEDRAKLLPKAPAAYPGRRYEKQAADSLALSAGLTDLQKARAVYWADGPGTVTPAGHWCQFAQYISNRDKHTLDDDVRLFFALSNALLDTSIACWDCKRKNDSIRPVSAIRFLYSGKTVMAWGGPGIGTQSLPGDAFQSYLPTAASPEYVSENSAFSAAAAQVLTLFTRHPRFGMSVTIAAGSSPVESGVPAKNTTLKWPTFSSAAADSGLSQRYAGVQFKDGDIQGRTLGKKIASLAWKKAQAYILGR